MPAAPPLLGSTGSTTFVLVVLLVALGVAMLLVAVWLVRATRTDTPALGPLEVMGDRRFGRRDEAARVAILTGARRTVPRASGRARHAGERARECRGGRARRTGRGGAAGALTPRRYCRPMASLDVDQMLARYRDRAAAVKRRPLPPVAGEERQAFIAQAQLDFQDFAIIGDAEATIEDGVLTLRVNLKG